MALGPRLILRPTQSLIMTPQLQQAIKLLQLTNLELASFIEQQVERNPLLEHDDGASQSPVFEEEGTPPPNGARETGELAADVALRAGDASSDAGATPLDTDFTNIYDEEAWSYRSDDWISRQDAGAGAGGYDTLDAAWSRPKSLREHLQEQLWVATIDPTTRIIGAYLIDSVTEAGYIVEEPGDVAEHLGTTVTRVREVLDLLQTFDPPGICARGLAECLALQLKEKNRLDPAMRTLVDHLDLLARRDLTTLRQLCGVDEEDLQDMMAELRRLNPKPGLGFGSEPVQAIIPDVFVRRAEGGWQIELNDDAMPRLRVNGRLALLRRGCSSADRAYISECVSGANWLIKSLEQRARTILNVASEIIRQQERFLTEGAQHLRPLNLRMVADAIGVHESTVSRATANKYMATPRGLFEMKYFFTAAIASSAGGEAHSAEAVRHRIKVLIDGEDAKAVLSDDRIVMLLRRDGIDIARRTVTKYREAMRIPSSVQRRRLKAASL